MRRALSVLALLGVSAAPAAAQDQPLASLLLRFFAPGGPVVVLQEAPPPQSHAAHFVSQPNAQAILQELNRGIATQLSTFPLGSSSPGFTFTFDPTLGVFNRSTESFGPVFAERSLTAGKGRFSFGVNYLRATYDRFEGQELDEDDISLYLVHEDTNRDGTNTNLWFEGDLIRADTSLELESNTTVFFANYGVGERFDVGIAIPFQQVDLAARIHTTIERVATDVDPFVVHVFPGGLDDANFSDSGSASGIGDIVLRSKYNFLRRPTIGVAAGVDLRLPTGDEDDLLGSGATQAKLYLVAGGGAGRFSPRATVGYTFSSGGSTFAGDLPDELNYSAGFDAALHPRLTFTADFLGRRLLDVGRLVERERTFNYTLRTNPANVLQTTRITPVAEAGDMNLFLGAAGVKVNPVGRLLVGASLLFALGDGGLQDEVTPVIGIDYSF